jgi:hypothetical protein
MTAAGLAFALLAVVYGTLFGVVCGLGIATLRWIL